MLSDRKPGSFLIKEDKEVGRTAAELNDWVLKILEFMCLEENKKWGRLRKGLAKPFYEEIYHLNHFARLFYAKNMNVKFSPKISNVNYDAIMTDYSRNPPKETRIEITEQKDGYVDRLQMEFLMSMAELVFWGKRRENLKVEK